MKTEKAVIVILKSGLYVSGAKAFQTFDRQTHLSKLELSEDITKAKLWRPDDADSLANQCGGKVIELRVKVTDDEQ